jgi:hypothetical protein
MGPEGRTKERGLSQKACVFVNPHQLRSHSGQTISDTRFGRVARLELVGPACLIDGRTAQSIERKPQ